MINGEGTMINGEGTVINGEGTVINGEGTVIDGGATVINGGIEPHDDQTVLPEPDAEPGPEARTELGFDLNNPYPADPEASQLEPPSEFPASEFPASEFPESEAPALFLSPEEARAAKEAKEARRAARRARKAEREAPKDSGHSFSSEGKREHRHRHYDKKQRTPEEEEARRARKEEKRRGQSMDTSAVMFPEREGKETRGKKTKRRGSEAAEKQEGGEKQKFSVRKTLSRLLAF